ncbi:MAG: YicC/YloC family endoribonuclease [Pseudomonadota bacterium]|nr:YicC/YloC family endoribonuclease [Pseudomonadota bacterium]
MTHSMTAFARAEASTEEGRLIWELRSLNHRFLEAQVRLPDAFREIEPATRAQLRERLQRGKVEATLRWQPAASASGGPALDPSRLAELQVLEAQVRAAFPEAARLSCSEVLGLCRPVQDASDPAQHTAPALACLATALEALLASRAQEGAALAAVVRERLDQVDHQVEALRRALPELRVRERDRLQARLAECATDLEPQRLEQEVVLLAQKSDISEELDRLVTHIQEFRRLLNQDGPIGRRLDFLTQELNREANTTASKAAGLAVTDAAIELKVLIEQIREQIQNIE